MRSNYSAPGCLIKVLRKLRELRLADEIVFSVTTGKSAALVHKSFPAAADHVDRETVLHGRALPAASRRGQTPEVPEIWLSKNPDHATRCLRTGASIQSEFPVPGCGHARDRRPTSARAYFR